MAKDKGRPEARKISTRKPLQESGYKPEKDTGNRTPPEGGSGASSKQDDK